jgi:hypothetical protein
VGDNCAWRSFEIPLNISAVDVEQPPNRLGRLLEGVRLVGKDKTERMRH